MKCGLAFIIVVLFRWGECADGSYEVSFENYYDVNDDSSPQERPLVHIPTQGSFEGDNYVINGTDINVMRFLGIKYASVPVGGRFKKGLHVEISHSARKVDVSKEPLPCPSFPDLSAIMENERRGINVDDCLTLSVYTRKLQSATYLESTTPVVVYIHGELLFDGAAEEAKPDYLLKNEIVLVSVNYRLAPFGFLFDNNTQSMPGNVALADLEMALEWVSKNIIFFGGDPNNISIMGQSGGATLAHALAISGKVSQYFHKMILMGGTALNPYLIEDNPEKVAIDIAKYANCRAWRISDVGRCLANKRTSEILEAFYKYKENHSFHGGNKLVVGDIYGYIPKHPALMVNDPEKKINFPLLAGVTQHFGAYLISRIYSTLKSAGHYNQASAYIDIVLDHTLPKEYHKTWKNFALSHIFHKETLDSKRLERFTFGLIELVNMIQMKCPLVESLNEFKNAVYLYNFQYNGKFRRYGITPSRFNFRIGPSISDENIYLFPYPEEVSKLTGTDVEVSMHIVDMWVEFIKFGAPTEHHWPKASNKYGPYIKFGKHREVDTDFTDGLICPNYYDILMEANQTTTTAPPLYGYPVTYRPYAYKMRHSHHRN